MRTVRPGARLGGWGLLAITAAVAPFVLSVGNLNSLTRTLTLAIALMGLQVLVGHAGLLSLGQGALIATGATMSGMMVADLGLRAELAIPLAAVAMGLVGLVIGLPALRLKGIGLALLTLGLAVSFPILHQKYIGPLGESYGRSVGPPSWTGLAAADDELWTYLVALVTAGAVYAALRYVLAGPFGRSLKAVRDEPVAAAAFGIQVSHVRLAAFVVSSAAAGVAGALVVARTPFVWGGDWPFQVSIQLFAVIIVVGSDRLLAALAGAIMLTQLPRLLSAAGWIGSEDLIYAVVLLIVILRFRARGVGPWVYDRLVLSPLGQPRRRPSA